MSTLTADSQIAAFLEGQPYLALTEDAHTPQVIFRGALELDREQEQILVDHVFRRAGELEGAMGYDKVQGDGKASFASLVNGSTFSLDDLTWMEKRLFFDHVYHMKFNWRRGAEGIYKQGQNIHFPMTRKSAQQMVSRAQNHFFGSDSWATAKPKGAQDPALSDAANSWAQLKFREAGLRNKGMKAVELAGIRGECVVKTGYRHDGYSYETYATVAIGADGKPIRDVSGEVITEGEDQWELNADGQMVLSRDKQTPQPEGYTFAEMKIRRDVTTYSGSDARPVDFRNFLAPLDAPDLQGKAADCIVEYYDMTAIEIVTEFIKRMQEAGRWDEQLYPRTLDYLRTASSNSRSSSAPTKVEAGADVNRQERADPVIRVAEVHLWFDATQTGRLDNVHLLIDRDTKRPILYDHVANVYDDGKRPYYNNPWWQIDGCWHGIGAVEIFWELQRFIDLTINRWDLSLSEAGTVTFFNSEQTKEGQNNPALRLNAGTTYRKLDPNLPAERIVERIPLNEFKGAKLEAIMSVANQMMTNLSGTAGPNDAAMAGLNTVETATGANLNENTGREMFNPILVNMEQPITQIVERSLAIEIEHMDDEEAFEVEGEDGLLALQSLKKLDAKRYKWRISLEVTGNASNDAQELQANAQARDTVERYYSLAPLMQTRVAPIYRQILRKLKIKNVDKLIVIPTAEEVVAYQQAMMQQAQQQQTKQPPQQ